MSAQHWIDALFRKRMGQRDFPVEEGEFEEVRALLRERNSAAGAVRGGGISKWWLSALLPMAGLLWWAYSGDPGRAEARVPSITEERRIEDANTTEQIDDGANNTGAQARSEPAFASEHGVAGEEQQAVGQRSARTAAMPRAGSDEVKRDGIADTPVDRARRTPRSDRSPVRSAAGATMRTASLDEDQRSDPHDERSAGVAANASADESAEHSVRTLSSADQASTEVSTVDPSIVEVPRLFTEEMEAPTFMELRWSVGPMTRTLEPMRRDMEAFKRRPMGELHAFGAPLAVRTKSSTGERSGAEMGSLVGLDYRVRTKRFSWATGIHYGSYAIKGDQGATDVKLNVVEVPLLASYQLSRRRFAVALQGGLSMDLLFNSRGRYRVEGNGSGAAFPDDAFRTVNWSWLLRPQVTYHVADRLSVNAGPLWKAQISEVANAGPLAGAHVSSSGMTIGITWRLDRSTF